MVFLSKKYYLWYYHNVKTKPLNGGINMCYLKLFDKDLISFEMDNKLGLTISNIKILCDDHTFFQLSCKGK